MKKKILFTMLFSLVAACLFASVPTVIIGGSAESLRTGDSVSLSITQYTGRLDEIRQQYVAVAQGNRFSFQVPAKATPQYLQLSLNGLKKVVLEQLIIFLT